MRSAAEDIPEEVTRRLVTADRLSDEDRETIIEIARRATDKISKGAEAGAEIKEGLMTDTTTSLRRKINSAGKLQSVVRTMKALAASSIGQYEQSIRALGDYYRTVELGLSVCFRSIESPGFMGGKKNTIK